MKQAIKYIVIFVLGALVTYFVMKQLQSKSSTESSHIIEYELKKLSKLITAEQSFSEIYSHKSSNYIPGLERFFSFDKKVVLLVSAKLQASYNMKEMEVELDSVNQIIHIKKIPEVKIEVFPDVKFYDFEQSTLNTFDKDELNGVKKRAIKHLDKKIDEKKIKAEAHQQLIQNLNELYFLAKEYGWEIQDDTPYAKEVEQYNFN